MVLADVVEKDATLVVTQSKDPSLRDLRISLISLLGAATSILFYYLSFPYLDASFGVSWGPVSPTGQPTPPPVGVFIFLSLPFLWMVIRSINRLFGKETFIFDTKEDVFIRNGYKVGPLREIRQVTVQVTAGGNGQNPMFRLILELPRCQTVTIVTTHYLRGYGEFSLSRNGFGDPNKRFAVFEPWLDCDKQDLIPFIPQEILELRQRITEYVGEPAGAEGISVKRSSLRSG